MQQAYDQAVSQQEQMAQQGGQAAQEMPPMEDVEPQLEQQVTAQKESQATEELATALREDGDVTIHL